MPYAEYRPIDERASATLSYALRYTSSYFTVRQKRSMNTLSRHEPFPSMLMAMPFPG